MTKPIDERTFLARVRKSTPFANDGEARRAVLATLAVLRAQLEDGDRAELAEVLPETWREALRTSDEPHPSGRGAFFERVQEKEHVSFGVAEEHAEAICAALGKSVPPKLLEKLDRALPKTVDELLHRPSRR